MRNELSRATFEALISSDVAVVAAFIPAVEVSKVQPGQSIQRIFPEKLTSQLPLLTPYLQKDLLHLAWENGVPVFAVGRIADPDIMKTLNRLRVEIACVSCFPMRIPGNLLSYPPAGFLNLHPSLLPAYRGPEPLFWIFRNGDQANSGITVHYMDEELDTGDIVYQEPITFPDGISGLDAETECGQRGGRLLAKAVGAIGAGAITRSPQPGGGSYFQSPTDNDFELNTSWSARRAYNFMRGTAEWGRQYHVVAGGQRLRLSGATGYRPEETLAQPVVETKSAFRIQFSPGVLTART
jgi:methionyl-tRNA formyltransferase